MILFLKHHGFDNGLYMCTFIGYLEAKENW